jgi:putative tryptophan/tyrosine transport system substrate-binding protein
LGGNPLRRREFTALLGSAAITGPRSARAQQAAMPVIGFLDSSAPTAAKLTAFYEGLKIEGFVRNQNVAVEYHSAGGDYDRLPGLAADLVNRKVAAIASTGTPAALAAKNATTTIPIIFALASDPVQSGLIGSLYRPGGNISGATNLAQERIQKRLELLHELIPTPSVLALLINPANPSAEIQTQDVLAAARKMGIQVNVLHASAESDFAAVFATLTELRTGGLAISDDELFASRSAQLAQLTVRCAVPAIFQHREFVAAGGLMSYGSDLTETYHQAGVYSGLILKGGNTADLPVYQSTKVEFLINLKTARSLGLTVPLSLLGRANEVIQ